MMRAFSLSVLMLLFGLFLLGMGSLGGRPEGTVPQPKENIRARIVDRSGVSTEVEHFSLEGRISLEGKRGQGEMTVLFKKLKGISFARVEGEAVPAELKFKNGGTLTLIVNGSSVFYGSTRYGAFRIRAGDIRKIEILPPPAEQGKRKVQEK